MVSPGNARLDPLPLPARSPGELLDVHVGIPNDRPDGPNLVAVFKSALNTGHFIGGEEVEEFEREFADFCGVRHCVGVGSGTDALRFALRRLLADQVAAIMTVREGEPSLIDGTGLPLLHLGGLDREAAALLLREQAPTADAALRAACELITPDRR